MTPARFVRALLCILPLVGCAEVQQGPAPVWSASVIEEPTPLPVTINGKDYVLDALIVRGPGDDKLPVALITHGASPGSPRSATLDWLRGWAHDLAHRGWLAVAVMRRGYGKSEGDVFDDAGTCTAPHVDRYLEAHADDLEAALRTIARRPDADMGHVLAIGDSAGGAAVMALAARPSVHLSAVVDISGGLGRRLGAFRPDPACGPYESDLVRNFARFGTTARMPTLWLYAENDSWFRPALVGQMHAAFTGTGGRAELVMLPRFGDDGHTLFYMAAGRQLLLAKLDSFLRANGLPTWDRSRFMPLLARLPFGAQQSVETYLQMPTEKALVFGPDARAYWHYGEYNLDEARAEALAYCKEKTEAQCSLKADNFSLIDQAAPKAAAR